MSLGSKNVPGSETKPIRLLLVDDHEVLRLGLRTLFEEAGGFQVVGEAGTMAAAVTDALRLKPKVVLMDVRLPDGSGIEACRTIRTAHPDTRVLFLTSFADDDAVLATILAGADGFLLKEVSSAHLIDAVKTVAGGQSILDPAVTRRVLAKVKSLSAPMPQENRDPLSPQEERVLALVAEGKTNKEIAVSLNLSEKTVGHYLENIFQKLQVTRRAQAAVYFTQQHTKH
jgi:DNA-binding NarL/FixJ family response regulator